MHHSTHQVSQTGADHPYSGSTEYINLKDAARLLAAYAADPLVAPIRCTDKRAFKAVFKPRRSTRWKVTRA